MADKPAISVHQTASTDTTDTIWRISLPAAPMAPALAELGQALAAPLDDTPHALHLRFISPVPSPPMSGADGRLNRVRERALVAASERAFGAMAAFPAPIVAEVRGEANELACALLAFADLILASDESRFAQGERGHLSYRGYRQTIQVSVITAHQALHAGLINAALSPAQLDAQVRQLLAKLRQDRCSRPAPGKTRGTPGAGER